MKKWFRNLNYSRPCFNTCIPSSYPTRAIYIFQVKNLDLIKLIVLQKVPRAIVTFILTYDVWNACLLNQ